MLLNKSKWDKKNIFYLNASAAVFRLQRHSMHGAWKHYLKKSLDAQDFCMLCFFFSPSSFLFSSVKSFSAYNFWNVKHMLGCSVAQVPLQQPLLTLYQSQFSLWSPAFCPSPACCRGDASSTACSSGQGLLWRVFAWGLATLGIHPWAALIIRVFNRCLNTQFDPTGGPTESSVSGYNLVAVSRFRSERHTWVLPSRDL